MHLTPRYSRHAYAGGEICKREGPVDGKFDDSGTLTKASNRHADPLLAVPMIVEFDHIRCKASDWSVSGFRLETPLPGPKLGDVRSAVPRGRSETGNLRSKPVSGGAQRIVGKMGVALGCCCRRMPQ